MKDLRDYSLRHIVTLWAGGGVFMGCLVVGAYFLQRPASRVGLNEFARRTVAYQSRDKQVVDDYVAYARAHPNDRAAQAEARRRTAEYATTARTDSMLAALMPHGAMDTTFHPETRTPRSVFAQMIALFVAIGAFWIAVAVPVVLLPVTVWWAFARRRPPASTRPV